jgi:hypothetical protein
MLEKLTIETAVDKQTCEISLEINGSLEFNINNVKGLLQFMIPIFIILLFFQSDQTDTYSVDFVLVFSDSYFNKSSSKSLFEAWTNEGGVLKSFPRCQFHQYVKCSF